MHSKKPLHISRHIEDIGYINCKTCLGEGKVAPDIKCTDCRGLGKFPILKVYYQDELKKD